MDNEHRLGGQAMDDKRLDRNLRSIGMDCFVSYYNLFADEMLSNAEIADIIFKERGYTFKACNSRTSHSRAIIRAGRAKDALEMVTSSSRVSSNITEKAQELLQTLD
jgi:hypothetical protein